MTTINQAIDAIQQDAQAQVDHLRQLQAQQQAELAQATAAAYAATSAAEAQKILGNSVTTWREETAPAIKEKFAALAVEAQHLRDAKVLLESMLADYIDRCQGLYALAHRLVDETVTARMAVLDVAGADELAAQETINDTLFSLGLDQIQLLPADWVNSLRQGKQARLQNVVPDYLYGYARSGVTDIRRKRQRRQ